MSIVTYLKGAPVPKNWFTFTPTSEVSVEPKLFFLVDTTAVTSKTEVALYCANERDAGSDLIEAIDGIDGVICSYNVCFNLQTIESHKQRSCVVKEIKK